MSIRFGKILIVIGSILVLAAAATLLFIHTVSGGPSSAGAPVNFNGSWRAETNHSTFEATVVADQIQIRWISENTSALYWKGTFPAPPNAHNSDKLTITSVGDTEAMSQSLLGSQNPTKVFTYNKGKLGFELTITGLTTTIYLEQEEIGV